MGDALRADQRAPRAGEITRQGVTSRFVRVMQQRNQVVSRACSRMSAVPALPIEITS